MNIIENRKKFFLISAVLIAVGLVMMVVNGLNYGMDFTGGTQIQVDLEQEADLSDLREVVDKYDSDASILHAGEGNKEIIIRSSKNIESQEAMELFGELKDKYEFSSDTPEVSAISATIGDEIKRNAVISIVIAAIGMLLYISFRFELRFGISAVVTLIHDALLMVAVYAIFRLSVDSTFIAAILTVIGYSINDTIVLFDRIRENSSRDSKLARNTDKLVNESVRMTLKRSILTSFTTAISLVLLYVLGVESIRNFAFPLTIGILVGTYSSIFIASPIWYEFKVRANRR